MIVRMLLLTSICLLFPASASALSIAPSQKEIPYGSSTKLQISGGSGDSLRLIVFPFPYEEGTVVGEWPSGQKSISVRPDRNSRYRLLEITDGEITDRSQAPMVWVQPAVENVAKRNGAYIFVRGSLEFSEYFWDPYRSLSAKEKKLYLYQRCPGASWNLLQTTPLRARLFTPKTYISWQLGTTLSCRGAGYRTVGFFYFSSILPSGDEGLGKPRIDAADARRAKNLLGKKELSPQQMKKYFPPT